jgi:hypothetical protein
MKIFFKKISLFICLVFASFSLFAQNQDVEMADAFRADGKIYVVIAVISVVLAGMFFYLFKLDKKITNVEQQVEDLTEQTQV